MTKKYDLVVVGAGIIGLGHAAAALERGLSVVVIDRATAIVGATVRNFGHVGVTAHSGQAGEYARRSRELWLRLADRANCWIQERGTLILARHQDELAVLAESGVEPRLSAEEVSRLAPVVDAIGGAHLPDDLQVDPREAGPAVAAYLASEGVEFRWRTSAFAAEGNILHTSRGQIEAEAIVFAVGHDIDHVFPEIAELHGVERCALDMILTDGVGLELPVLTGSSLLRYSSFSSAPAAADVRARLEIEVPGILEHDVNQMYTERPDGTLLVGDTHVNGTTVAPFQPEEAFRLLKGLAEQSFGRSLRPIQRWQGVYAKAPQEFLNEAPADNVRVVAVTTGAGMTCGLGLAESVIEDLFA